jgi:hypothetical protein
MAGTTAGPDAGILLVDDGELDAVAEVLESQGLPYERICGGPLPDQIAPPLDLLIVTPRHVHRVRRGSPAAAQPGRPLRIIAAREDSPAMRRRLRRTGLNLLVRLPTDTEIWRLLIARALYQGSERRGDERVAVGSPVEIGGAASHEPSPTTILVDLSNRGCRLQTEMAVSEGDAVAFTVPAGHETGPDESTLTLRGRVRRILFDAGSNLRALAVVFDPAMPETDRTRLTALINRWASGPSSMEPPSRGAMPAIPPCQLAALPDLTLDDETDPPVAAQSEIRVRLSESDRTSESTPASPRRTGTRGRFESSLVAEAEHGRVVLIGRDLSAGGMRIERGGPITIGDRLRIAIHGPAVSEPVRVHAEVVRDDGDAGFALVFDRVDAPTTTELEKIVACLPDVESLDRGESGSLGAILSELIPD